MYRVLVLTHGSNNWLYIGGTIAIGLVFLLGMVTAHLANYPLHQYVWRAPAFAVVEVLAEMAVSALLIAVGHEANGTVRAHWDDWVGLGLNALLYRGLAIVLWCAILAGVIQIVRRTIVHEDEEPERRTRRPREGVVRGGNPLSPLLGSESDGNRDRRVQAEAIAERPTRAVIHLRF